MMGWTGTWLPLIVPYFFGNAYNVRRFTGSTAQQRIFAMRTTRAIPLSEVARVAKLSTDEVKRFNPALVRRVPKGATLYLPKYIGAFGANVSFWYFGGARQLAARRSVLMYDLRGHGKSAPRGRSWRNFSRADWLRLPDDIRRTLVFFTDSEDYPQVDGARTAIIGASSGMVT